MRNMWIQFHYIHTLGLQRNILGKKCDTGENLKV